MQRKKPVPIHALVMFVAFASVAALASDAPLLGAAQSQSDKRPFTASFRLQDCTFRSTGDANPFFILDPGHRLVLRGEEDGEEVEVRITVLRETQDIALPGLGTVRTRVVEEREWVDGEIAEVSRNFFALCAETSDVYYFGEDVDNYEDGVVVDHHSAWRAGVDGATPGLIMPGTFLLGSRYFQEVAPGVALDRGENQAMDLTVATPAGIFAGCVSVFETTPLEPGEKGVKVYAPGVGLIVDETLVLEEWTPAP
jgi:hypothetical protein